MSVERFSVRVVQTSPSAQPVVAGVSLSLLIYALGHEPHFQAVKWPLLVSAASLGVGLVVGRVAQRAGREAVHTVAAVAALLALIWLLSGDDILERWPLQTAAVLLGLGLVAGPLAQLATGRPERRSIHTVAAVAALLVLIWTLSRKPYLAPLPSTLAIVPYRAPTWPLTVAAVLLCLGLLASSPARIAGRRVVNDSLFTVDAVAALLVLLWTVSTEHYLSLKWPLSLSAVFLGLGLLAGTFTQLANRPREKVLSKRVEELSRTRRGALDVQASELRRIERDLHDGAQARLVALSMKLGRAEDRYRYHPEIAALLREAREDATAAIRELRELARGIAPPVLTDRGLEAAVRSLAQRSGAEVTVSGGFERRPVPVVETAAYFVVAESLPNAVKHAPGAQIEVRLDEHGGDLFLEVTDFGPGGAHPAGGLIGLRQRVEALDGALHVTSPAGVGTQVEAVLPCGW